MESKLSKECPVLRPFYGFMVPGPVVSKNGLTLAGQQGVQTMQVQQLNANHHELREVHPFTEDTFGTTRMLYCVFCAAVADGPTWQAIQQSTDANVGL